MKFQIPVFGVQPFICALITVLVCSAFTSNAQSGPAKHWDRTFGSENDDVLCNFLQTPDGGFILAGYSGGNVSGDKTAEKLTGSENVWLVKLDATVKKVWDKSIAAGEDGIRIKDLQLAADGGFIMAGIVNYFELVYARKGPGIDPKVAQKELEEKNKRLLKTGRSDVWVAKSDANGSKLWEIMLGGNDEEYSAKVQQTSDKGYIVGITSSSPKGSNKSAARIGSADYWVVKLDANGKILWDRTFGGTGSDHLGAIQETTDKGFIVTGYSDSGKSGDKSEESFGKTDFWVLKLDASGNKIWDKSFGGKETDALYTVKQTSDGGYILGGYTIFVISGNIEDEKGYKEGAKGLIVKIDANGKKEWEKELIGADDVKAVLQLPDGNYLVGCSSSDGKTADKSGILKGVTDIWLVKLDKQGKKIWDKTIGGPGLDVFQSISLASDGGILVGSKSKSGTGGDKLLPGRGEYDYWVVKLKPEFVRPVKK